MYRVMVRSYEGWRLQHDSKGLCWERREVWSTYTVEDGMAEADNVATDLRAGGNRTAIVEDGEEYARFCATHRIC